MQRFLIRRFFMTILSVLVVSVIIFAMARMAGDPRALMMGPLSTADQWDLLGKKLGLDKPYYHQYFIFMKDLVQGDFGTSIFEHRPAGEIIGEKLRATVELGALGLLWSTLVGVPLGVIGAVRRDGIIDRLGKAIVHVGWSTFRRHWGSETRRNYRPARESDSFDRSGSSQLLAGHNAHVPLCREVGMAASLR